MGEVIQGSTLYAGSVWKKAIYKITQGEGYTWGKYLRTEINMDRQPRQLTRAIHSANPLQANILNPRAADFAASSSSTTIDGRQLSVADLILLEDFNVEQFKETFPEYQPTGLSIDLRANTRIASVVQDLVFDAAHNQINTLHSAGNTVGGDLYDGFVTKILADADATQVGTPTVISEANAVTVIRGLKNAIPSRLYNRNMHIFCSHEDANLFQNATSDTQTTKVVTDINGVLHMWLVNGRKVPIIPVDGIPKDFLFTTPAGTNEMGNLVQGFWMANDKTALAMYKENEADQVYRLVFRISTGVEYVTGEDIFYLNNV